ncbi:signal peptidase II [Tabrizicola oligotrophica]|uniref:Lipoprotein signal peptidase n=1 Tax=Tabrizicola oligotrophica TaxID=2710650 RepID=A0A6M0QRM4_9RHOB|nr:signal peptidase II [Tabrizicola oligotrophica]NEY90179.1 signal peptidase II [Tabrizicola oligotrophica]
MRALAVSAFVSLVADQASKLLMIHALDLPERGEIDVIDPLLNFRWAENRGVNFGLLSGDSEVTRWLLVVLAVVISGWVIRWARKDRFGRWGLIAAGLLVGGAMGNVIDRLAYGYVADFLNMSCCGIENPYAFNIADIAIFAGAIGLVLFTGKGQGGKAARKR